VNTPSADPSVAKIFQARDLLRSQNLDIPDAIVQEFVNVTAVESGRRHFNVRGEVILGPPTPKGRAIGFSQIMPATARQTNPNLDPLKEIDNIALGLQYYASNDPKDPVARRLAYVGGPGSAALNHYRKTGQVPDWKLYSFMPDNKETHRSYVEKTGGFKPVGEITPPPAPNLPEIPMSVEFDESGPGMLPNAETPGFAATQPMGLTDIQRGGRRALSDPNLILPTPTRFQPVSPADAAPPLPGTFIPEELDEIPNYNLDAINQLPAEIPQVPGAIPGAPVAPGTAPGAPGVAPAAPAGPERIKQTTDGKYFRLAPNQEGLDKGVARYEIFQRSSPTVYGPDDPRGKDTYLALPDGRFGKESEIAPELQAEKASLPAWQQWASNIPNTPKGKGLKPGGISFNVLAGKWEDGAAAWMNQNGLETITADDIKKNAKLLGKLQLSGDKKTGLLQLSPQAIKTFIDVEAQNRKEFAGKNAQAILETGYNLKLDANAPAWQKKSQTREAEVAVDPRVKRAWENPSSREVRQVRAVAERELETRLRTATNAELKKAGATPVKSRKPVDAKDILSRDYATWAGLPAPLRNKAYQAIAGEKAGMYSPADVDKDLKDIANTYAKLFEEERVFQKNNRLVGGLGFFGAIAPAVYRFNPTVDEVAEGVSLRARSVIGEKARESYLKRGAKAGAINTGVRRELGNTAYVLAGGIRALRAVGVPVPGEWQADLSKVGNRQMAFQEGFDKSEYGQTWTGFIVKETAASPIMLMRIAAIQKVVSLPLAAINPKLAIAAPAVAFALDGALMTAGQGLDAISIGTAGAKGGTVGALLTGAGKVVDAITMSVLKKRLPNMFVGKGSLDLRNYDELAKLAAVSSTIDDALLTNYVRLMSKGRQINPKTSRPFTADEFQQMFQQEFWKKLTDTDIKAIMKNGGIPEARRHYYLTRVIGEGTMVGTIGAGTFAIEKAFQADDKTAGTAAGHMVLFHVMDQLFRKGYGGVKAGGSYLAGKLWRIGDKKYSVDEKGQVFEHPPETPDRYVEGQLLPPEAAKQMYGPPKPDDLPPGDQGGGTTPTPPAPLKVRDFELADDVTLRNPQTGEVISGTIVGATSLNGNEVLNIAVEGPDGKTTYKKINLSGWELFDTGVKEGKQYLRDPEDFSGQTKTTPKSPDEPVRVVFKDGRDVIQSNDRQIVIVEIDGVQVPFYKSTGRGGKKDVAPNQWFPFFGLGEPVGPFGGARWFNKTDGTDMNRYYGSAKMKRVAEWLNQNYADIDPTKIRELTADDVPIINKDLNPAAEGILRTELIQIRENINQLLKRAGEPEYFIRDEEGNLRHPDRYKAPEKTQEPAKKKQEPAKKKDDNEPPEDKGEPSPEQPTQPSLPDTSRRKPETVVREVNGEIERAQVITDSDGNRQLVTGSGKKKKTTPYDETQGWKPVELPAPKLDIDLKQDPDGRIRPIETSPDEGPITERDPNSAVDDYRERVTLIERRKRAINKDIEEANALREALDGKRPLPPTEWKGVVDDGLRIAKRAKDNIAKEIAQLEKALEAAKAPKSKKKSKKAEPDENSLELSPDEIKRRLVELKKQLAAADDNINYLTKVKENPEQMTDADRRRFAQTRLSILDETIRDGVNGIAKQRKALDQIRNAAEKEIASGYERKPEPYKDEGGITGKSKDVEEIQAEKDIEARNEQIQRDREAKKKAEEEKTSTAVRRLEEMQGKGAGDIPEPGDIVTSGNRTGVVLKDGRVEYESPYVEGAKLYDVDTSGWTVSKKAEKPEAPKTETEEATEPAKPQGPRSISQLDAEIARISASLKDKTSPLLPGDKAALKAERDRLVAERDKLIEAEKKAKKAEQEAAEEKTPKKASAKTDAAFVQKAIDAVRQLAAEGKLDLKDKAKVVDVLRAMIDAHEQTVGFADRAGASKKLVETLSKTSARTGLTDDQIADNTAYAVQDAMTPLRDLWRKGEMTRDELKAEARRLLKDSPDIDIAKAETLIDNAIDRLKDTAQTKIDAEELEVTPEERQQLVDALQGRLAEIRAALQMVSRLTPAEATALRRERMQIMNQIRGLNETPAKTPPPLKRRQVRPSQLDLNPIIFTRAELLATDGVDKAIIKKIIQQEFGVELTDAQLARLPEQPPVGDTGQTPYFLRKPDVMRRLAGFLFKDTDPDMANKVNDPDTVKADFYRKAVLDAMTDLIGIARSSQMKGRDWEKLVLKLAEKNAPDNLLIDILEGMHWQTSWARSIRDLMARDEVVAAISMIGELRQAGKIMTPRDFLFFKVKDLAAELGPKIATEAHRVRTNLHNAIKDYGFTTKEGEDIFQISGSSGARALETAMEGRIIPKFVDSDIKSVIERLKAQGRQVDVSRLKLEDSPFTPDDGSVPFSIISASSIDSNNVRGLSEAAKYIAEKQAALKAFQRARNLENKAPRTIKSILKEANYTLQDGILKVDLATMSVINSVFKKSAGGMYMNDGSARVAAASLDVLSASLRSKGLTREANYLMGLAEAFRTTASMHGDVVLSVNDSRVPEISKVTLQEELAHRADIRSRFGLGTDAAVLRASWTPEQAAKLLANPAVQKAMRNISPRYKGRNKEQLLTEVIAKALRDDAVTELNITPQERVDIINDYITHLADKGVTVADVRNRFADISANADDFINQYEQRTGRKDIATSGDTGTKAGAGGTQGAGTTRGGGAKDGGPAGDGQPDSGSGGRAAADPGKNEKQVSEPIPELGYRGYQRIQRDGKEYLRSENNPEYEVPTEWLNMLARARGLDKKYVEQAAYVSLFRQNDKGWTDDEGNVIPALKTLYKKGTYIFEGDFSSDLQRRVSAGTEGLWGMFSMTRSLMSSGDISTIGRQGWRLIVMGRRWTKELTEEGKAALAAGQPIKRHSVATTAKNIVNRALGRPIEKTMYRTVRHDLLGTMLYNAFGAWRKGFYTDFKKRLWDDPFYGALRAWELDLGSGAKPTKGDVVHDMFRVGEVVEVLNEVTGDKEMMVALRTGPKPEDVIFEPITPKWELWESHRSSATAERYPSMFLSEAPMPWEGPHNSRTGKVAAESPALEAFRLATTESANPIREGFAARNNYIRELISNKNWKGLAGLGTRELRRTLSWSIRGSQRSFDASLVAIRVKQAKALYEHYRVEALLEGKSLADVQKNTQEAIKVINMMTGFVLNPFGLSEENVPASNQLLFSTRLGGSHLRMLNPLFWAKLPAKVKKEGLVGLSRTAGIIGTMITTAAFMNSVFPQANIQVIYDDPSDPGLLRFRFDKYSVDISSGSLQWMTYLYKMARVTKDFVFLDPNERTVKGYRDPNLLSAITGLTARQGRKKLAPIPGAFVSWATGETVMGEPTSFMDEVGKLWAPITWRELAKNAEEDGNLAALMFATEFFGFGTSRLKTPEDYQKNIDELLRNSEFRTNDPGTWTRYLKSTYEMYRYAIREKQRRDRAEFERKNGTRGIIPTLEMINEELFFPTADELEDVPSLEEVSPQ